LFFLTKLTISFIFVFVQALYSNDSESYLNLVKGIEKQRDSIRAQFLIANDSNKNKILQETRSYLISTIVEKVIPCWYGTKWEFYGKTRVPKEGSIACGYFVNTILSDVGFKVPIDTWSKLASETFIKKLSSNNLKRFSNKDITDVIGYLLKEGDGLYIVGLDCHVGYVCVYKDNIQFIHSNYYNPSIGVMSEGIGTNNPLKNSRYRVFGKLLMNDMLYNWLNSVVYH
jgi:hypothetical protein